MTPQITFILQDRFEVRTSAVPQCPPQDPCSARTPCSYRQLAAVVSHPVSPPRQGLDLQIISDLERGTRKCCSYIMLRNTIPALTPAGKSGCWAEKKDYVDNSFLYKEFQSTKCSALSGLGKSALFLHSKVGHIILVSVAWVTVGLPASTEL